MTDIDEALATTHPEPESAVSVAGGRRCRHDWWTVTAADDTRTDTFVTCRRCGAIRDEQRARQGKRNRRLGGDTERRLERLYGPRKVGEYGDAIDLLGRDFAWQSKATRGDPPKWLALVTAPVLRQPTALVVEAAAAMIHIAGSRAPLVIQSFIRRTGPKGEQTRDWIWVRSADWRSLHGWPDDYDPRWLVMSGSAFLEMHGRDEP